MRKWLFNNKGFTLVELVVTIAIMTVVGGAITAFIVTSQKNFNSGSAEAELQYEAQLVENQLQDLLIDSARGISYSFNGQLADGSIASNSNIFADTDSDILNAQVVDTKSLYIYNEKEYYVLEWVQAEKKIYFSSYIYDPDSDTSTIKDNRQLLAEFVTGFSVDLRDVSKNHTVKYVIHLEKTETGKEYTTSHKIKLRNEVLVNIAPKDIYTPEETPAVAGRIILNPPSFKMWPGESANISASVTSTVAGGGIPSQNVIWEITRLEDSLGNDVSSVAAEIVDQSAGNGVLTLKALGKEDPDKKFEIKATKAVGDSTIDSDKPIDVLIRDISYISAVDNAGRTSAGTAEENQLSQSEKVELAASIFGTNLDGLSIGDMEGVNIEVEALAKDDSKDPSLYIENLKIDENKGTVQFKVKEKIQDDSVELRIRFSVNKEGYTDVECVMKYALKEAFSVSINKDSWKRQDELTIQVKDIDPDLIYTGADGKQYLSGGVKVTFHFYDSNTGITCKDDEMGNNANVGSGNEQVQTGAMVKLSMNYTGDFLNLNATLLPDKFAYSYPYYIQIGDDIWSRGADKVDITITLGGKSVKRTLSIEPVSFGYGQFLVQKNEEGEAWNQKSKVRVYVTDEVNTVKVFYNVIAGWDKDNTEYGIDPTYYVGIIGDSGANQRMYFQESDNGSNVELGADGGEKYVKFTLPNQGDYTYDKMLGQTVTVKYEYNPFFGSTIPAKYKERFKSIKGCGGDIEIVYVKRNVEIDGLKKKPSVSYCPAPAELSAGSKHYISETERYIVKNYNGDNTVIGLQVLNGRWTDANPGCEWKWNAQEQKWNLQVKRDNVDIWPNSTEPSYLYCPSPDEFIKDETVFVTSQSDNLAFYQISDKEYYVMNTVTEELYYSRWTDKYNGYFRGIWGDAVLTWSEDEKCWTHPESNMDITAMNSNGMTIPTIPYCPSPNELEEDNITTYYIHCTSSQKGDEYFTYDSKKETITYGTASNKAVWGKYKLQWDNDKWVPTRKANVVINDGREKPQDWEYCPEPGDTGEWVNDRYYLNDSQTEWYALSTNTYDGNPTIAYYTDSSSWWQDDIKIWGDAELYWDEEQQIWRNYENNVVLAGAWSDITIPYCPSPNELSADTTLSKNNRYIYYYIDSTKNNYYRYDKNAGILRYYYNGKILNGARTWDSENKKWVVMNIKNIYGNSYWNNKFDPMYCPSPDYFGLYGYNRNAIYELGNNYYAYVERQGNKYQISLVIPSYYGYGYEYVSGANTLTWDSSSKTWKSSR